MIQQKSTWSRKWQKTPPELGLCVCACGGGAREKEGPFERERATEARGQRAMWAERERGGRESGHHAVGHKRPTIITGEFREWVSEWVSG